MYEFCTNYAKQLQAAIERAVKPTVAICVTKLTAMETDTAEQISQLRRRVDEIVAFLANQSSDYLMSGANTHSSSGIWKVRL